MTQKEFEKTLGHEVEAHEFDVANEIYSISDLTEEEFCKEWETAIYLDIVGSLYHNYKASEVRRRKAQREAERSAKEFDNLQDAYERLNEYTQNLGAMIDQLKAENEALKMKLKSEN